MDIIVLATMTSMNRDTIIRVIKSAIILIIGEIIVAGTMMIGATVTGTIVVDAIIRAIMTGMTTD